MLQMMALSFGWIWLMMDESVPFYCKPLLTERLRLKENNLHQMLWIIASFKTCFLSLVANSLVTTPEELNLITSDQALLLRMYTSSQFYFYDVIFLPSNESVLLSLQRFMFHNRSFQHCRCPSCSSWKLLTTSQNPLMIYPASRAPIGGASLTQWLQLVTQRWYLGYT